MACTLQPLPQDQAGLDIAAGTRREDGDAQDWSPGLGGGGDRRTVPRMMIAQVHALETADLWPGVGITSGTTLPPRFPSW